MSCCPRCPIADQSVRCQGLDVLRFCALIDPSCGQYDPGYLRVIEYVSYRIHAAPAPPSTAESAALVREMKACPFRSAGTTGCGCGHCGLRTGALVSHGECFKCINKHINLE